MGGGEAATHQTTKPPPRRATLRNIASMAPSTMTGLGLITIIISTYGRPAGAAAPAWSPLKLAQTEHGYDNHDEEYPQIAECMKDGDTVALRGHVQCLSGDQDCWGPELVVFATLPPQWPPRFVGQVHTSRDRRL